MCRQAPAISKNFPASKLLPVQFPILPVVNSKKQLVGVIFAAEITRRLGVDPSIKVESFAQPDSSNNDNPIERMDENSQLWERTVLLRQAGLVTYSPNMMVLINLGLRVARVDSTVLISGESGVGKELLARLIHSHSPRSNQAFIKINCGAIPANLLESELFGYDSGAFTGANRQGKPGMFELANDGTLFLDEIGELPLELQVKLLRAIQEQEFVRVGGVKARQVNIRFLAATNRDLEKRVEEGKFREDLFYRLNVIPLLVPPLRERKEDILPLVHHFQAKCISKFNVDKDFAPEVLRTLHNYAWPGNVRELENIVERLFVTTPGQIIRTCHLPAKMLANKLSPCISIAGIIPLRDAVDELQRLLIEAALEQYGDTYQAAEALEVNQSTITRKMAKFKIRIKS